MTDVFISQLIEQLTLLMKQQIEKEYKLVVGVSKEVRKLKSTLQSVQAVLVDAEKRQVKEAETVKVWLGNLKNISYDMDDVLSEWSTAILKLQIKGVGDQTTNNNKKKVCFFISLPLPCFSFNRVVQRRDIALKIKDITERLDLIAIEKERYKFSTSDVIRNGEETVRHKSTSYVVASEVCGRNEDMNTLVSKLCSESTSTSIAAVKNILQIISIVGLGGIGKTTLAQKAYDRDEVKAYFEIKMWVCVSKPFDQVRVAKAIVEEVERKAPNVVELETTLSFVKNCVEGKKFLLVLDDVWTEDSRLWEPFKCILKSGASGSKVLLTTRNERVAKMMETTYILRLRQLSDQDCWSLFSRIALFEKSTEEYQDIGRKISDKCKGLPLAAKTIASLMLFKTTVEDWRNVLNSEIWELEGTENIGIFPPLLLSYYELPSSIKRCFIYCANFPKDYSIEADNLIKLWMAQGYLNSGTSVDMEVTGREYLDTLIVRSFFQDLEKDKDRDNVIRFKMHDMVHDLAQSVTKNECSIVKADSGKQQRMSSDCRHLTLIRGDDFSFPERLDNTERLHTFWVQSFYDSPPIVSQVDTVPSNLFHRMRCLKALDLSRNRLRKLPKEVGEVMNLRYLNLSFNPLEELPEAVCDLCNLQTLKLLSCNHLTKLPRGIGKLINLRHLEIDGTNNLTRLPEGIGRLSALRTLSKFVIGGGGAGTEEAACKLGDLKNLNDLRECLPIEGLGYVADAGEAEKAELKKKEHLLKLSMNFSPLAQAEQMTCVAEALQPHTSLTWLEMKSYGGSQFPSWMISLIHLKKLRLLECQNCVCLPPLGRLPSLETLHLEGMHNLKCIGHTFLGSDGRVGESSPAIVSFPKLKKLKIAYLTNWEEWDVISTGSGVDDNNNLRIMPCLHYLKLSQCDKLKTLPETLLRMAPLRRLRISNCCILKQRYLKGGEDWIKVCHIPKIHIQ